MGSASPRFSHTFTEVVKMQFLLRQSHLASQKRAKVAKVFPFWIPLLDMRERAVGVLNELRLQVSGADADVVVPRPATGLYLGVRLKICASESVGAHVPPFRGVIPIPGEGMGGSRAGSRVSLQRIIGFWECVQSHLHDMLNVSDLYVHVYGV